MKKKIYFQNSILFVFYILPILFLVFILYYVAIIEFIENGTRIWAAIIAIIMASFILLAVIHSLMKRIVFYHNSVVFYNENNVGTRQETAYTDIIKFCLNKKHDDGEHIVTRTGKKLFTLVLYCKNGKKIMLDMKFFSRRTRDKILLELKSRINLNVYKE